jgi:hypothetical protein
MKRIIDGVTYNTDTSTLIAKSEWIEEANSFQPVEVRHSHLLYQTRGGAFFTTETRETERKNAAGDWIDDHRTDFTPLTADRAREWLLEGEVELLNDVFGEPPEAAAESSPAATIYVRVPTSLKNQIEAAAANDKLSVNAWAIRCMEGCIAARTGIGSGIVTATGIGGGITGGAGVAHQIGGNRGIVDDADTPPFGLAGLGRRLGRPEGSSN